MFCTFSLKVWKPQSAKIRSEETQIEAILKLNGGFSFPTVFAFTFNFPFSMFTYFCIIFQLLFHLHNEAETLKKNTNSKVNKFVNKMENKVNKCRSQKKYD